MRTSYKKKLQKRNKLDSYVAKLLYVIQGVENSFGKVTSWPQLISEFLVAHACLQCCF